MKLRLSPTSLVVGALCWAGLFVVLSATRFNPSGLSTVVGFLTLVLLPGALTLLILNIRNLPVWATISLAVAFSLLELMLVALLGNTFLPLFHITRPLDQAPLLVEFATLVAILAIGVWSARREVVLTIKSYVFFDTWRDTWLAFLPVLFVVMSVFGAIRLNNGASNILTMVMLGWMGIHFALLIYYAKQTDKNVIPTALFFSAAALLLMTSLRGWYITGHDIQTEYKVFELTKSAGMWNIAFFKDPYNACLSITLLPTFFANTLALLPQYVFKLADQIIFALCPVLVYLTARHWTSPRISLISTMFFIGFPTFFTDMPFLTRQELAFVYFGLMLYIIFEESLSLLVRRSLFVALGAGVILSHYSTTYTILIVFGLATLSRPIYLWLHARFSNYTLFKQSALIPVSGPVNRKPKITLTMLGMLFAMSFLWTSIITNTGGHLNEVLAETAHAVVGGFGSNNRSVDVASLLTFGALDQKAEMDAYVKETIGSIRALSPSAYYPESSYSQYSFALLPEQRIPVTGLGAFFKKLHIDMPAVMSFFGQLLQKSMEVLAPIGLIIVLFRRSIFDEVDSEIYLISAFCFVFIGLNIVLPVLSVEYGIFRAMQQSMFIMAPFLVAGIVVLGQGLARVSKRIVRFNPNVFAYAFATVFFMYSTHFLPYLFGNTPAILHLSNYGVYYNNYLISDAEVYGVDWLSNTDSQSQESNGVRLSIQTDKYSKVKFASITGINAYNNIFPGVIRKDSYVFLNPVTAQEQRTAAVYNSDVITYQYPTQFLDNVKALIYTNGGAEVYR